MKKERLKHQFKIIFILSMVILMLSACGIQEVEVIAKVKPVKVSVLQEATRVVEKEYYGRVIPGYVKKYAFQTGGVLTDIPFMVGDRVQSGDVLARLSTDKLNIAVNTANEQIASAQVQVEKAKTALSFLEKNVADLVKLLESGAATQQQIDQVILERDLASEDLKLAQRQLTQARLQGQFQSQNRQDATLMSEVDGIIADYQFEVGELISPGYPVVIIKSIDHVVRVGLTAEDIKTVGIGDPVKLTSGTSEYEGTIDEIAVLPDEKTGTYDILVAFSDSDQPLVGELVKVAIVDTPIKGIWLPINAIQNDGVDYVYVVSSERAVRKNIILKERVEDEVIVEGLSLGDQLIVSGATTISHGYRVIVLEDGHE